MIIEGHTGPSNTGDGFSVPMRLGRNGDQIVTQLHGRWYEQNFRGSLFSFGTTAITALSANTITLTATTTPILGLWNPPGSGVNAVIIKAFLAAKINTVTTPVAPGAFVWAASGPNNALTLGSAPINRKLLTTGGSNVKAYTAATALTGLSTNLVIFDTAHFTDFANLTSGTIANTAQLQSFGGVQEIEGAMIVQPGYVLALLNTTSTTTYSYTGSLMWEEVSTL